MLPCSSSSVVEMEVCGDGEVEAQKVKTEVNDLFFKCGLSADDLSRAFNVICMLGQVCSIKSFWKHGRKKPAL